MMGASYQWMATVVAVALAGSSAQVSGGRAAPAAVAATSCRVQAPPDLTMRPLRWLGPCVGGAAQGLGVLRLGAGEPFQFFMGDMQAGRPVRGVLKVNASQLVAAYGFDRRMNVILPDGNRPAELDIVFQTGSAAASATARRFAVAGNAGSAAYYRRLADQYREPPFE